MFASLFGKPKPKGGEVKGGGLKPRPAAGTLVAKQRPGSEAANDAKSKLGRGPDAQASGLTDDQPMAASLAQVIDNYQHVPTHSTILTLGPRAIQRLPKVYEDRIMAIELGPRRVAILFDPLLSNDVQARGVITSLRLKLTGDGYAFDRADLQCTSEVLRRMVVDFKQRNGGNETSDVNKQKSEAKDRFMGWMETAVKEGATDLHVQVVGGRGIIQLRVDGELEMLRDSAGGVVTEREALESMAWPFNSGATRGSNSSSQFEANRNLYCMTEPMAVGHKKVSLRYQSLRGSQGPKMIARLLNADTAAPTLTYQQLGYSKSMQRQMLDVANTPSGFVLFAGVTGSGKTTTLKTFVETHPGNGSMAFYSLEDPVEYIMRGVHQIVMQRDVADKAGSVRMYNETVAGLMRADLDACIVGEIRDSATAGAGQQIVETGHMALGTVHAHLIPGIIPRLTNEEVGMSRDVLTNPNMLTLLAYQALVPKLCPKCCFGFQAALDLAKIADDAAPGTSFEGVHLSELVKSVDSRFKLPIEGLRFKNPEGCSACSNRGTKGVTVVAEMIMPDRQWLTFSRQGMDYEAMVSYRMKSDRRFDTEEMDGKTIFEHTLYKALMGGVDPRQCERFDSFSRFELHPELTTSSTK